MSAVAEHSLLEKPAIRAHAVQIGVEQYHRMCAAGIVSERTELLEGFVFEIMTKSPLHSFCLSALAEQLRAAVPAGFWTRQELPLTFATSEPEPDLSVVRGRAADFKTEHPRTAELVVEVSVTSVELDREKARIYARAGVAEYWLVEPQRKTVTAHRKPDSNAGQYAEVFEANAADRLLAPGGSEVNLAVIF